MIAYCVIITYSTYLFLKDADPDVLANTDCHSINIYIIQGAVKAGLTAKIKYATIVHMMLNFLPLPGCRSAFSIADSKAGFSVNVQESAGNLPTAVPVAPNVHNSIMVFII